MTREEQIKLIAFESSSSDYPISEYEGFVRGWKLGYKDAINNAIEWLYQRQAVDLEMRDIEEFINEFINDLKKKVMEEQ